MGKKQTKKTDEELLEEEYEQYCHDCKPKQPLSFHDWKKLNGYN